MNIYEIEALFSVAAENADSAEDIAIDILNSEPSFKDVEIVTVKEAISVA